MPTYEIINERFTRLLRIGLFNFMRRTVYSVSPKVSSLVNGAQSGGPTNQHGSYETAAGTALLVFVLI